MTLFPELNRQIPTSITCNTQNFTHKILTIKSKIHTIYAYLVLYEALYCFFQNSNDTYTSASFAWNNNTKISMRYTYYKKLHSYSLCINRVLGYATTLVFKKKKNKFWDAHILTFMWSIYTKFAILHFGARISRKSVVMYFFAFSPCKKDISLYNE